MRLRALLSVIVSIGVLVVQTSVWAADSPITALRAATDQAIAVLQDPAYRGADNRQQRVARIREIILPLFDPQEIAKRTMGVHWRDRTDAERKQFIELFINLVEKSYSSNLDRYNSGVQFFWDQERIDGDFAEADTRIFDPVMDKTFVINYRLHKVGDKWLIYDVVAENISMVRNYRNQFHRILSNSSYQDLVNKLQSKLKELDSPSPS